MSEFFKRLKRFDIEGMLSLILQWIDIGQGETDYLQVYTRKVEFAAHLFTGLYLSSLYWWTLVGWAVYVLISEFYHDGHWKVFIGKDDKWKDLCWDLGSKLFGPLVYGTITIIRML